MNLKIRVGTSPTLQGIRAIIATEDIKKDEIIEICPVVLIPINEMDHIAKTVITKYEFLWDDDYDALVLGYGSLYNHSFEPNMYYELDYVNKTMIYGALRDIKAGEELFIDYMDDGTGETDRNIPPEYVDLKH